VPDGDAATAELLAARGHALDSDPEAMVLDLDALVRRDPPPGFTRSVEPVALAQLNDDAYGMRSAFARALVNLEAGDGLYLYGAEEDGELASGLVTFDHGDDCSVWLVATRERSRGRGLAAALMTQAMADARDRGRTTSTLQATDLGRPVYERLGYRSMGEIQLWEKRAAA
jgi:GNAT superfamily N-acetyltransferase